MKKVKRISLALFLSLLCIILPFSSSAQTASSTDTNTGSYTEYYPDGRYMVVTVSQTYQNDSSNLMSTMSTASTVYGTKTAVWYASDNSQLFSFTVHGTFSYVYGVSSTCTASSYTYTVDNGSWRFSSGSASRSGNIATADGVFKRYLLFLPVDTQSVTIDLGCNIYGDLG